MQRSVRARAIAVAAVMATALALAPVAVAHHAWTEVDTARTLTLDGTVKSLKWENPHASLVLETVDGATRVQWTVLMSGLARMEGRGLRSDDVAVGKTLTIVASPARDEPRVVRANRIRSDGKDHVLY